MPRGLVSQKETPLYKVMLYFFIFSYSLTLVDALDTLAVMGNDTEFRRVAQILIDTLDFNRDINVSVFETNIRGNIYQQHHEVAYN